MRRVLLTLTAAGIAASLSAQTNDHFFRSATWTRDAVSARDAGLADAVVGLADDAGAQVVNPAALSSLQQPEISGALLSRQSGISNLDADASRLGLGWVGGGGRIGGNWALGGFLNEPHAQNLTLNEVVLPDGSRDTGYLRTVITEAGASVAWTPRHGLHLGARVTATHLELTGLWDRYVPSSTRADLEVGSSSGSTQVTGSFGALLELDDVTRLGMSLNAGAAYACDRTATSPRAGVNLEAGGHYDLSQPSWGAVGLSRHLTNRVLATAELDVVRYSDIVVAVRQGVAVPAEYALKDAVEPRAGLEISIPVAPGVASWQVRGGVHSSVRGTIPYSGASLSEQGVWRSSDRVLLWSAGTSVVARSWRIDAAITGGDADRKRLVLGASLFL